MIRRAFLLFALACVTTFAAANVAHAERLFVVDTDDGFLNLRSGPGTNYPAVQWLTGGVEVDGVGTSGNWRCIVLPDERSGWASASFLTRTYVQRNDYDAFVVPTSDGYLNFRSGPSAESYIIQRLYAGQGVYDLGRDGNWMRIMLPEGSLGWASMSYLR